MHITPWPRGTIAGDVEEITVSGNASDDSGVIDSVIVNDTVATLAADNTWTVRVKVAPGTNLLHAVAKDKQGNSGQETRAVVTGPMATLARQVPDGITATLSAQTFDAIGNAAAGFIKGSGLYSAVQGMNPVLNLGNKNGPDCLYAQASITSLTVGNADVVLAPQNGGLFLSGTLNNVRVGLHLDYAAACVDGSRDVTVAATKISIQGVLKIGIIGRDFDIKLENQDVKITGFDVNLGGIPGKVVDLLHLDTALGPVLGFVAERFLVPMLNKSLAGLNQTKTIDVLGTQVDIDVKPSQINFTPVGGKVLLNTSLRAKDDNGSFVFVANTLPDMDMSQGFQLAVADDAANQLLGSMWSAKGLNKTLELNNGSYGDVGKLYDAVELDVKVPPYVDATDGKLTLTIGDMVGSFKLAGSVATMVAINAKVDVTAAAGTDGKLRFDVGTPTVYVDIIDEQIEGSNQLSNAQFEAIASFALTRIVSVGAGTLGAVPLPSIGGVGFANVAIDQQHGYLIVDGEVQ